MTQLGKRIRKLRVGKGLSQAAVAAAANLDPKHVQLIEAGKTNTTVASLLGIARAIDVQLYSFFEGL